MYAWEPGKITPITPHASLLPVGGPEYGKSKSRLSNSKAAAQVAADFQCWYIVKPGIETGAPVQR